MSVSTPWAFKEFDKLHTKLPSQPITTSGTTLNTATTQSYAAQKCAQSLLRAKSDSQSSSTNSSETAARAVAQAITGVLKNDLEQVIFTEHSELEILRKTMERSGAITARLTGSGPTLYALVESTEQAEVLRKKLLEFQSEHMSKHNDSKIFPLDFWIAESFSRGARVIDHEA